MAFSDSCGGQNKNRNFVKFYMYFVWTAHALQVIGYKFLEPGHSFNECDEDFDVIRAYKN